MTARELDAEVAKFDRQLIIDETRPMTPAERAQEERARRKGANAAGASDVKRVVVKLDAQLVRRADAWARKHGTTRGTLIAYALQTVLGRVG
jgi:hypothetical protein